MKKHLLIFLILFLIPQSISMELTGGISYTVKSAREYVFKDVLKADVSDYFLFARSDNVERVVYSYDINRRIIGITVLYKDDHTQCYIYDENKQLIYVDKYDKDVNLYPHRGYRYNLRGKLVLTSLSVSKDEHFRFDPQGNLIAHSINGVIYDENGRIIGNAK